MLEEDIGQLLGASLPSGGIQLTLFIASKDRDGNLFDQNHWRNETLKCLGKLFRGATAFPPGKGVWRDDENGGRLLFEDTIMVIAFVNENDLRSGLSELRIFLHKFGRETNQGEVGIIVDGVYHGIANYDSDGGPI